MYLYKELIRNNESYMCIDEGEKKVKKDNINDRKDRKENR